MCIKSVFLKSYVYGGLGSRRVAVSRLPTNIPKSCEVFIPIDSGVKFRNARRGNRLSRFGETSMGPWESFKLGGEGLVKPLVERLVWVRFVSWEANEEAGAYSLGRCRCLFSGVGGESNPLR